MTVPNNNHDDNKLVDAYNRMMARIRDTIESAEASAAPTLQKAINMAKQEAIHLSEVTIEEAEEVGNYIKRDINDAAEYLMETSSILELLSKKYWNCFYPWPIKHVWSWSSLHTRVVKSANIAPVKSPVQAHWCVSIVARWCTSIPPVIFHPAPNAITQYFGALKNNFSIFVKRHPRMLLAGIQYFKITGFRPTTCRNHF